MNKPQRKPSIGQRESLQGSTNSTSKLLRTTPLIRTNKRPHSSSIGNQRESYIGTATHHTVKDTRPLSDKAYIRKSVSELITVLQDLNYPTPVSMKQLTLPTNKDYQRVFEFLVCNILGSYRILGKPDEEMLRLIKDLEYPFNISKSTFHNVAIFSSWPQALGVLNWLVDLLKYSQGCDEALSEMLDLDPTNKIKHEFLYESYVEFMEGRDGPYANLIERVRLNLEELNKDIIKEQSDLEISHKRLLEEYNRKLEEREGNIHLEKEIANTRSNSMKIKQYIQSCDVYLKTIKSKTAETDQAISKIEKDTKDSEAYLVNLKTAITQQELSRADLEKLTLEKHDLKENVRAATDRAEQLRKEDHNLQIQFSKSVLLMNEHVNQINDKYGNVVKSLPYIKKSLPGQSLPTQSQLNLGYIGLEKNKQVISDNIQPFIKKLCADALKAVGSLENERYNHNKRAAQEEEMLADLKGKKETLKQQYEGMISDQQKEALEFDKHDQDLQNRNERSQKNLEQLKCSQEESLEDLITQLEETKRKKEAQLKSATKEQSDFLDYLNKVSAKVKQCETYHTEFLSRFDTKGREIAKEFTDRLKDIEKRGKTVSEQLHVGASSNSNSDENVPSETAMNNSKVSENSETV